MYPHLSIERPSCFLEGEVVIQLLVGKVAALEGEIIPSFGEVVREGEVVDKLVGHYIVSLIGSDVGGVVGETVQILIVIGHS